MAIEPISSSNDSDLTPESVEHRSFGEARKGWDKTDVRAFLIKIASQLRMAERQRAELQASLRDAQRRAQALEELDDAELLRRFGETTAKLLSDAHAAGQDIRQTAVREAEEIASEIEREVTSMRSATNNKIAQQLADTDIERARRLSEADSIAGSRIADAERRAAEIRRAAEADAARYASATLERCRELVFEAQGARERLLRDLARRGRIANAQVEQLKAGRERLLESYRTVRRTLDEVTDDLTRADTEARAASDDVATRLEGVAEISTNNLITDLGLAGEVDLPDDVEEMLKSWIDGDPADQPATDGATALAQIVSISKSSSDGPHLRLVIDGEDIPSDGDVQTGEQVGSQTDAVADAVSQESGNAASAVTSGASSDALATDAKKPSRRDAKAAKTAAAAATSAAESIVDLTGAMGPLNDIIDVDAPAGDPDGSVKTRGNIDDIAIDPTPSTRMNVDALFARLRADRTEDTKRAQEVLDNVESAVIDLAVLSTATTIDIADGADIADRADISDRGDRDDDQSQTPTTSAGSIATKSGDTDLAGAEVALSIASDEIADEIAVVGDAVSLQPASEPMSMAVMQMFAERDGLLAPLIDRLSRALKRTLQDEQNDLLDALRPKKSSKKSEVVIPVLITAAEHADAYRAVAIKLLTEVSAVGTSFACGMRSPMVGTTVEIMDLVDRLAIAVSATLHERLDSALNNARAQVAAGSPVDERVISEQISAIYRDHKLSAIDQPAADAVYATFARASMVATSPDTIVRWIVDTVNAPCAIGDDNAMAGAVKLSELFSNGRLTVPSCDNYRCMVVVDSSL